MEQMDRLLDHPRAIRYLKRPIKRYVLPAFIDCLLVAVAFYAALSIHFASYVPISYLQQFDVWLLLITLMYVGANYVWRIYDRLWHYATLRDIWALAKAVSLITLVLAASAAIHGTAHPFSVSQALLGGLFAFLLMLVVRIQHISSSRSTSLATSSQSSPGRLRALIVGAGDHGQRLARHFQDDPSEKALYEVVGFVDDDQTKLGLQIHGLRVLGTREQIERLVRQHGVDQIIIASRSTFGDSFDEIVGICQKTPAQIKVLPRFCELLGDQNHFPNLRDLTIQDLLEREAVSIDYACYHQTLAGRVILVTGAGGSIGSELCRQLMRFAPRCLVLIDNNETALHDLHLELTDLLSADCGTVIHPLIADVTNARKMLSIFRCYNPQIIFHAAAYKHVPEMEMHPDEAVRVNVVGTVVLTDLAHRFNVERFIFISTDKAVNPTSVMGASKRIGELWIAAMQSGSVTRFAAVRFGNVVGSRGSVVPLFNRQIERQGPITVTHPRMKRFFMSIPEAASLIIQAGAVANQAEIYVLDMGQPISIVDLAQKMIRLKGLRPGRDIQIKFTGIRPGEKLDEELAYGTERHRATVHPKIFCLEDHIVVNKKHLRTQIEGLLAVGKDMSPEAQARLRVAILALARADVVACSGLLADDREDGKHKRGPRPLKEGSQHRLEMAM